MQVLRVCCDEFRQNSQEWHEACQKEMQVDAMKSWEMQLKEREAAKEYAAKENKFWNRLRSENALLQVLYVIVS